jgi:hypothetical protein
MKKITIDEVKDLLAKGHVVFAYPKKGIVTVDGFKKFKASNEVFEFLKSIKK